MLADGLERCTPIGRQVRQVLCDCRGVRLHGRWFHMDMLMTQGRLFGHARMSITVRPAGFMAGSAVVRLAMGGWPLRQ